MSKTNLYGIIAALLGSLIMIGACAKESESRKLSVALSWKVNANSAGPVIALSKGFYQEAGLDVEIVPGGLGSTMISSVAVGESQIGISNAADAIVSARSNDVPLVIVAATHERNYHGFFAREGSGIEHPRDWIGKRVGVKNGSSTFLMYRLLLNAHGIERDQINEVPVNYDLSPFLTGQVDVFPGASTNEAIVFERNGIDLTTLAPADFGVESYSGVIVTSERFRDESPETLERFITATMRGWDWALTAGNEREAAEILAAFSDGIDVDKEELALIENRKLINPDERGKIDGARLERLGASMQELGIISRTPRADEIYRPLD